MRKFDGITLKKKILIVDDLPENLFLLKKLLVDEGYTVVSTTDGIESIQLALEHRPDMILMDISMPEISGIEVCRKMKDKEELWNIPVVFVTASLNDDDIRGTFEAGGVDYVKKPINSIELTSKVKTHLKLQDTQRELIKQNNQLVELNNTKSLLFSIISHDLRGPFTSTLLTANLLLDNKDKFTIEQTYENIEKIKNSLEGQFELLENLLGWSRLQLGTLQVQNEILDIGSEVKSILKLLKNQAAIKDVKFSFNSSSSFLSCETDKFMFGTIIRNLVTNAIKFSPINSEIIVKVEEKENEIVVSIKDFGEGISPEDLANLFIYRKNKSKKGTMNEKGSGFGLILCKDMANKLKGKISVNSRLGMFTEFSLSLPK